MKITEIRALTDEELLNAIEDQKESLYNLRFQKAVGQIEDLTAPRRTQRTISRLMTIARERQLAAEAAKKGG